MSLFFELATGEILSAQARFLIYYISITTLSYCMKIVKFDVAERGFFWHKVEKISSQSQNSPSSYFRRRNCPFKIIYFRTIFTFSSSKDKEILPYKRWLLCDASLCCQASANIHDFSMYFQAARGPNPVFHILRDISKRKIL